MNTLFGYPGYDQNGVKTISTRDSNMMMDIKVYRMKKGEERRFYSSVMETAVLLMSGKIEYVWEQRREEAYRENVFKSLAYCLHVCRGTEVQVRALEDAEILVQQTDNLREFPAKYYLPCDNQIERARYDVWESTAKRDIGTLFDYNNAPYSNMVCGEIYTYPGRWSSYPPHSHEQPEVYYYRFEKPQGFGACFIGNDVFKIQDGSYCAIPGGLTHPQVTAPGYRMYYVWMIRHFDGNPWTQRIDDPDHAWLYQVTE